VDENAVKRSNGGDTWFERERLINRQNIREMNIEIDYNPSPSSFFFISIPTSTTEAISFDNTVKGHRVVKQLLVEKKFFPLDTLVSSEWDTIVLEDGKFVKKYHVRWIDMGELDWCNDEVWKTVFEQPILEDLSSKLLHYSTLVSDNYENLERYDNTMHLFEQLLKGEIAKLH
jgi:hypothetical protein